MKQIRLVSHVAIVLAVSAAIAAAATTVSGVWKGNVTVPVNVPFRMELHQAREQVTGTVFVGPAKFPILDGHVNGDTVRFSTVHDVRIVSATKTEKMDTPVKFNYTATFTGDKCHIAIVHADGTGAPNAVDGPAAGAGR